MPLALILSAVWAACMAPSADAQPSSNFSGQDLFALQFASDPQVRPGGATVAYVRQSGDVMADRMSRSIWAVDVASGAQRPLVTGPGQHSNPRWSPDGTLLAYISTAEDGRAQIFVRWAETGASARIATLPEAPSSLSWSRDGARLAFTMFVPDPAPRLGTTPAKPEGAVWAEPIRLFDNVVPRTDAGGVLRPGHNQIFVVSAEGGAPRQLTYGPYLHAGPLTFTADGAGILFAGNRDEDWRRAPREVEIYRANLAGGPPIALTSRVGLDIQPSLSPDGRQIAYLGYDETPHNYSNLRLYLMNLDGSGRRELASSGDRSFDLIAWAEDGRSLFAHYVDRGVARLARISLDGSVRELTDEVGGGTLDRPYSGGAFDEADGVIAFTTGDPDRPADLAVLRQGATRRLTDLNANLFAGRRLGEIRPFRVVSTRDNRALDAWMVLPPDYVAGQRRPTILEIHGGPSASYGPYFATDMQLYAAAGYVVLYVNARNSTSYGEEFARHVTRDAPFPDYEDFISTVDTAIAMGVSDPDRLFVTGGSYGGYAAAALIGRTHRFRAAALQKPVINWISKILTTDISVFESTHYYGPPPWEDPQTYWAHSPLSLVGNVQTPTLIVVGERDYRTPVSESEQYYTALQLRRVPTALAIVPGASHGGLTARPSQSAARASLILAWFDRYGARPAAAAR